MQCPINNEPVGDQCQNERCLFHSKVNKNGCFYGSYVGVSDLADHKDIRVFHLRKEIRQKHRLFLRYITIYRYLDYCSPIKASQRTSLLCERLKATFPFHNPLFRNLSAEKLEAMLREDKFAEFCKRNFASKTEILQDYDSLEDFLTREETIKETT